MSDGPSASRTALPIDAHLASIVQAVASGSAAIVQAAPGAGKTTRVPPALLSAVKGQIVVLEPRRLAARLSAERVASERSEQVGDVVGYQIRFDQKASAATRLIFVTEGVFMRRALDDPQLSGIGCVIIDEFHERHIHTDMALAVVRQAQARGRPDLKLVVMSATLDQGALARYLPDAARFDVEGRAFPVAIEYLPPSDPEPRIEEQVRLAAARMLSDERCAQDILVFLTGMQEIRRCAEHLRSLSETRGVDILPLSAEISPKEQMRVFANSVRRKIILATNVAETSLTIPGVTGVIDAGRAKIAGHAAWSGMPTLDVKRVSQASVIQRTGRAGRVRAGVCYRLFTESDYLARPAFTLPDIKRLDFAETLLSLLALGRARGERWTAREMSLPWFEAPEPQAVEVAAQLFRMLGIIDAELALTPLGERVARIPLHPRLGAIIARGQDKGIAAPALLAAALISEQMILSRGASAVDRSDSDVIYQMELFCDLAKGRRISSRATEAAIDRISVEQVRRLYDALARRLRISGDPDPRELDAQAFAACLLAGFPDRVARRRFVPQELKRPGDRPLYNFCLGRGGVLADASVVSDCELILALDVSESVQGRTKDRSAAIYIASAVTVDALLESPADLLAERVETVWNDSAERVDVWSKIFYGQIAVSETRATTRDVNQSEVEDLLRAKLAERWPKPFADASDLEQYHERVRRLEGAGLGKDLPLFEGEMRELLLATIVEGKRSFKDIAERSLADYIHDQLPYDARTTLANALPAELALSNGRRLRVHYEADKPPYLMGFIQDFFGVRTTPSLLGGRLGLTLHLLAPNRRPIQVTSDLEGFWRQHYAPIKQELCRNYPRHNWPDDPTSAEPNLHKPRRPKP